MAVFVMVLLVGGMLQAKSGKGDKFFKEGQAAEMKQDWDHALELYQQALDEKPGDSGYTIAMRRARFQAGQMHVNLGEKLRSQGKLSEALGEFQKALMADPSSPIAIQEIKRTQQMIDREKGKTPPKPEDRGQTPAEQARRDSDEQMASILSPPELKPIVRQIGPLKMNNQPPKVLFETVGKLAGINVLFDSQFTPPSRNFNVELPVSSAEQALDYLAVLTHTFWKPVAANAVFITEDNPTKHRDYDDQIVKTFYVTNATSVQEFQEIAVAIRTVADIRRVFTYNAQKAMIVRGTVDAVALAEKLVHDLDKPKSEVVIDVIVMEASSSHTRNLAASLVTAAGTPGLSLPFAFTPRNPVLTQGTTTGTGTGTGTTGTGTTGTGTTPTTTPTNSGVSLAQLAHISTNDFSTTLPGALLNLMLTDSKTKVRNSPQLRASDGQKATLKIGDRIPYATGSFQPGVGTVGVSPLVSTQFNFVETGVNVDLTPQVHSPTELTLHIEVEVSSVNSYVNLGGISQPVIGQRKNIADIRLREGEVSIIGGLSSLSDAKSVNGIPGLVNIPLVGKYLFGGENIDKEGNELLIALVPHIIRTPDYTAENLRGIYAGNENAVKLNYSPKPEPAATVPPPEGAKPEPSSPFVVTPTPPATPAPAATPTPATPPPATPAPAGQTRVSFMPAALQTTLSSVVTVAIQVENGTDLFAASPLKIKFDPAQLRLNEFAPGDVLSRDGGRVTSVKDIRNDTGEATLTVSRLPGSSGVSGTGVIATLSFVAVGKGSSTLTITDLGLKNSQQQSVAATLGELPVKVQ
jgi:general secretion pathway protein D